jgi:hypothetical protein
MVRVDDRWLFAASTVEGVRPMAQALGTWWVASLPAFMVDVRVAEIELWQWIVLVLIALAGLNGCFGKIEKSSFDFHFERVGNACG